MNTEDNHHSDIIDLVDFYRKWPKYKKFALNLKSNVDMSDEERNTLHWLIELADRVGQSDIKQSS